MTLSVEKHIKAILFDIGGTLVQKQDHGYRDLAVIQQMVTLLDANCTPEELVDTIQTGQAAYRTWQRHSFIELAAEEKWTRFLLADYPTEIVRTLAPQLQDLWRQSRGKRWLAPHARQTLKELRNRGYILATVSHTTPQFLNELGAADLFQARLHAARFGKRKPHPAIFLAAARECGVKPAECAFVGDRLSRDVIGSREAGLGAVILVQNEFSTREFEPCPMQADLVIPDIAFLLDHFKTVPQGPSQSIAIESPPALYDGALSTLNWDPNRSSLNAFLEAGREMGFARFELNHQIPPEVFEQIDLNRFHFGSLHNPCPAAPPMKVLESEDRLLTSLDENLRHSAIDVLKNTIETGYRLGARSIVIHSGWVKGDDSLDRQLRELFKAGQMFTSEYEDLKRRLVSDRCERGKPHLERLIKSLDEIFAFAAHTDLLLGIENLMHYYELPGFDEMQVLLQTFTQPNIGWQLDVGHLQIHQNLGLESMQRWLDQFGERLVGIHHHDVIGIDDHLHPGCGSVNFAAIAAKIRPQTQVTLEVKPQVTSEQIKIGLQFLVEQGCIARLD